jgi:hypothetical protein
MLAMPSACDCGGEPAPALDASITKADTGSALDGAHPALFDAAIPEPDAARPDASIEDPDAAIALDAGVACPGGCDDQNPCTEDFCDIAGVCQHYALANGTSCSSDVCKGAQTRVSRSAACAS